MRWPWPLSGHEFEASHAACYDSRGVLGPQTRREGHDEPPDGVAQTTLSDLASLREPNADVYDRFWVGRHLSPPAAAAQAAMRSSVRSKNSAPEFLSIKLIDVQDPVDGTNLECKEARPLLAELGFQAHDWGMVSMRKDSVSYMLGTEGTVITACIDCTLVASSRFRRRRLPPSLRWSARYSSACTPQTDMNFPAQRPGGTCPVSSDASRVQQWW